MLPPQGVSDPEDGMQRLVEPPDYIFFELSLEGVMAQGL